MRNLPAYYAWGFRKLFPIVIFLFISFTSFAQQKTVSGKVSDPDGQPVVGATVSAQGTNAITQTNSGGDFSLSVPSGTKTLTVSSVGFAPQTITIGAGDVSVSLVRATGDLTEVVVTSLGIQRKTRSLQYSITTVGGENLTQAREMSIVNSLEGRVAGVNVSKIATGPGASTRVVIRGAKTLGSTLNQPLYVVDGVPMDNTNFGQAGLWGGTDNGDGMSSISPDDVASITVLKGASAAALYGSRAANGVILVTTKKGSAKKGLGIEINSNYVFEQLNDQRDFQTDYGEGGMVGTTLQNRVATRPTTIAQSFGSNWSSAGWGPKYDGGSVVQFDGVTRKYQYAGDNWKRFFETGNTITNSVALTGGSEMQNFRFSVANLDNTGNIPNSGYNRVNVSLATNSKMGKKITFNSKILYSNEKVTNRPFVSDSPANAIQSLYRLAGDINVLDLLGDPNKPGAVPPLSQQAAQGITIYDGKAPGEEFQRNTDLWTQNPYWAAYQHINTDIRDRVIASGNIRYDITDFLYVQGQAGMDWYTRRYTNLTPQGVGYNRNGGRSEGEQRVREINYEWTAGFNKAFLNNKLGVNAFVGGNRMRRNNETIAANGTGFNTPLFAAINNANQRNFGYGYGGSGINSLFGSAELSYNNYLFVTGTARKDWFSVLNPEDNAILYPSVGASFVFSDAFKLPAWVSYGKARLSWAQVGNVSSVGPYSILLAYSAGATHTGSPLGTLSTGQSNGSNLPNINLKPFTSTEMEYGLEARFLKNRLGLDLTYYDQETTEDILNAGISRASGFTSTTVNLGKITNKGIEVLLTGTPIKGDITWDVSLNMSKNTSKVVALIEGQKELTQEEPRTRNTFVKHIVGLPYGMITGKVQMRDPASGLLVFNEADGTPVSDGKYYPVGNGVPDFIGGLNNSVIWKGVNLTFLIDFKSGGDIFSGTNMRMTQQGFTKMSLQGRAGEAPLIVTGVAKDATTTSGYKPFTKTLTPGEAQNYWNQTGGESNPKTDMYLYDASFIKLRQITLGYTIPKKFLGKTPVQSLMVSFVGRNLAILKKNTPNIDPESTYSSSNSQGFDYFGFPSTRTFGFNVRATF